MYVLKPDTHMKSARDVAIRAVATAAPNRVWSARWRIRRGARMGKRRASHTTSGVAAAHGHQSVSDRSIESRQLAGRPVDWYVRELPAAKNSASPVQPAQTVNQARARVISLLLE